MKTYTFKVFYNKLDEYFIEEVQANSLKEAENEIETLYMYFGGEYYYRLIRTK